MAPRPALETEALLARRPPERRFFDLSPTDNLVQELFERRREGRRLPAKREQGFGWSSPFCWKVVGGVVGVAAVVATAGAPVEDSRSVRSRPRR